MILKRIFTASLIAAICYLIPFSTTAQIEKGTFSIEPQFSAGIQKVNESWKTGLFSGSFEVKVGYFFINNLELGILGGYRGNNSSDSGDFIRYLGSKVFMVGPELNYYISLPGSFYLSVGGRLTYRQSKIEGMLADSKNQYMEINFGPGIHYIVDNKLGVFFKFGPQLSKSQMDEQDWSDFKLNMFRSSTGVSFYF